MPVLMVSAIARRDGERLMIDAPYTTKSLLDRLNVKYDHTARSFYLPLTWANCLGLRRELGDDLVVDDTVTDWARVYRKHADSLVSLRDEHARPVTLPDLPGFDTLYPHQRTGIDLICRSAALHRAIGDAPGARYLEASETGTGKTRVALGAISVLNGLPAIVLCPKSVIRSWADEARRFFPDAVIREVHGTITARRKALAPGADLYIMSYESLRAHSKLAHHPSAPARTLSEQQDGEVQALKAKTLVVDEVHRCASPKTKQTRAAWAVADEVEHVIAMTGTPIQESPEDLWSVLRMLDRRTFSGLSAYRERYLDLVVNPFGGWDVRGLRPDTAPEFFAVFHTMSRRAEKAEVLPFLPPKVNEIRWITLPPPLRKAYRQMADEYLLAAQGGTVLADNAMVVAGRLIQLANATLDVIPSNDPDVPDSVRMAMPSPKITAFMEDVAAGDFTDQSVVVFSDSRQLLDLCADAMSSAGIDFTSITGDTSADERADAIERFQRGDVQYILISRAGDTGITLTRASTMVRLTRSWSFITHTQAEDRVHRLGSEQHDSILYIDYITEDTLEEGQVIRLNTKREKATAVLQPQELAEMITSKERA